ncbi:transposase, MuDR, MULE transposase domain protein [Tanacetum coccineum]|uniref:Transposase, MuDR, MULE transposase domain protein n=1 Tax=Tanacetum coccineum TaxID=301880 RepID=A0ABQ4XF11_9ASTR
MVVCTDGYNQNVPIAFGICKGETGPCWSWWMSVLKECIGSYACDKVPQRHIEYWWQTGTIDRRKLAGTCQCRKWQLSGLPCGHVIAVTKYLGLTDCLQFVSDWFKKPKYQGTYAEPIHFIGNVQEWEFPQHIRKAIPPRMDNPQPGRPKNTNRIKSQDPVELERFSTNQVKRILNYSLGYDENSPTFLYLRKPNCSLDSGLVPLADALQDLNMLLTYAQSHQNRLHVYVSRVEISPLVVAYHHKDEDNKKEKQGKPSCSKKLFD